MRLYRDFKAAKNEIARDLNELGVRVKAGYQSKKVDLDEFETTELQNYDYRVVRPRLEDLDPIQPWAEWEWSDRLRGIYGEATNPGSAWTKRKNLWDPLREGDGKFSYTYSERLKRACVPIMLNELRKHPQSRQVYISIWDPYIDGPRLGYRRVPCSLGYQLMLRDGAIHLSYHMRSSDFATHFDNDLWLALMLQRWFATELDQPIGSFTHVLGSLHTYTKNVEGVF